MEGGRHRLSAALGKLMTFTPNKQDKQYISYVCDPISQQLFMCYRKYSLILNIIIFTYQIFQNAVQLKGHSHT